MTDTKKLVDNKADFERSMNMLKIEYDKFIPGEDQYELFKLLDKTINEYNLYLKPLISEAIADSFRINTLQTLIDKSKYSGKCILRISNNGRGMRLHESSREEAVSSIREAIDIFKGIQNGI